MFCESGNQSGVYGTYKNKEGAIQIIRDTFLAYFRPPLPHVSFGYTDTDPPPPPVCRDKLFLTPNRPEISQKCLQKMWKSHVLPKKCHVTFLKTPPLPLVSLGDTVATPPPPKKKKYVMYYLNGPEHQINKFQNSLEPQNTTNCNNLPWNFILEYFLFLFFWLNPIRIAWIHKDVYNWINKKHWDIQVYGNL